MNKLSNTELIREDELQGRLDPEYKSFITDMVTYILNPQDKLPPMLKDNNLGFIFASNLLNLAAEIDFGSGIISVEKDTVMKNYGKIQDILDEEYKPEDNLCYYPLHMIKSSNSSKFIHGLPYIEILNKWDNEFEQNEEKLRDYIETLRNKIHIDIDIEIVSAKIIGRSIYLRIENEDFDVTIPLGYSTKHENFTNNKGEVIELNDCYGNMFSPQGFESVNYYYTDVELTENINKSHGNGSKFMLNFFAWRAPEYVSQDNYIHYYHKVVDNNVSDEEAIKQFGGVLHHFKNGMRVIIQQVNDQDGNFLSTTQDQILPNYGHRKGSEEEQENYNYWKNTYENELFRLVNLGVDSFRIDLAHGFRKNNDCNLLKNLIKDIVQYAQNKYNKNVYFILETYDFSDYGGTNPATFRDWNNDLPYPAVKVYHKETEDKLSEVRDYNGIDNLLGDLQFLFQDIRGIHGEMMAASTFDDYTLRDIANKSGIDHIYILELEILLGKAGYNVLSLDRDFLGEHGEIIPTVPGGNEEHYGSGKFRTHTFSSQDEFIQHSENNSLTIFENSESLKTLKQIENYGEIKGINIDKKDKKIIFTFTNNNKRIFDFSSLVNGGKPYTETSNIITKNLSVEVNMDLVDLELKEQKLINNLKLNISNSSININDLPNVYDFDFWLSFVNYVKFDSWNNYGIEEWDVKKQEAYFLLNRDALIKKFLGYKKICILDEYNLDDSDLSSNIRNLKNKLESEVKKILKEKYKSEYPDLIID